MHKYFLSLSFSVAFFNVILTLNAPHLIRACSSRTIPRPRPSTSSSMSASLPITTNKPYTTTTKPTTTTQRPNITFPTYKCPADYDKFYCLNGATCFSVKIGESLMYNCECAIDFMGPRCEFKELDGSYLPQRPRLILEKASIASGATCALFFIFFIALTLYLRYDHQKLRCVDEYDYEDILNKTDVRSDFDCSFCHDIDYCCNTYSAVNNETDLLATAEKYTHFNLRRYFETISPLSFVIKRSPKL